MKQFEDFAKKYNVTMKATPIKNRAINLQDWVAAHWKYTLYRNGKPFHTGEYSSGLGNALSWLKTAPNQQFLRLEVRDYRNPLNHEGFTERLTTAWQRHVPLSIGDVLWCLQMDTMSCDQKFEDWAPEYGYDPDSRKAYAIWESVNNERRNIRLAFTAEELAEFYELEDA